MAAPVAAGALVVAAAAGSASFLGAGAGGVAGFLARELPPDGAPIAPFGCIGWLKRLSNESGPGFLKRARAQAESVEACLGLAFTNNG